MPNKGRIKNKKEPAGSPVILSIIVVIIIAYIIVHLFRYFTTKVPAVYEVKFGYLSQNNILRGICVRDEKVVSCGAKGHINYFVGEGQRVGVNTTVYSIDNDGEIYEYIKETKDELSKNELKDLRDIIKNFSNSFSTVNFEQVGDYRSKVDNFLTDLKADKALKRLKKLQNKTTLSFNKYRASDTGNISFYTDGFEGKSLSSLKEKGFDIIDESSYEKKVIRNNDIVDKKTAAYKLLNDENWQIVSEIDRKTYSKFEEIIKNSGSLDGKINIRLRFIIDNTTTNSILELYKNGEKFYAILHLKDSAVRFLDYRYLSVELLLEQIKGIKIPITSVTSKTFFELPKECLTKGEGKDKDGVILRTVDKNSKPVSKFVEVNKIITDEGQCFAASELLKEESVIEYPDNPRKTHSLRLTESLQGVYNVNKGYCVFNYVDIIDKNEQYYIVDSLRSELKEYDHIILDSSLANENMLLNSN